VIYSHSDGRTLARHLEEVVAVARTILASHRLAFPGLSPAGLAAAVDLTAACHDLAKATPAFQAYLAAGQPSGDPLKRHALLSACYAFHRARSCPALPPGDVVPGLIACAIAGHHTRYPGFARLKAAVFRDLPLLHQQLAALDPAVFTLAPGKVPLTPGFSSADLDGVAAALHALARPFPRRPLEEKIRYRILGLFLASVLLEADRTRLAFGDRDPPPAPPLPDTLVRDHVRSLPVFATAIGDIRGEALAAVVRAATDPVPPPIQTLTLPTGAGKTLAALHYALALRARSPGPTLPKIVAAMPYLAIIEQTDQTYRAVLQDPIAAGGDRVHLARHSVAPFSYHLPGSGLDDDAVEFLLSTWQAEVVTTTFDQVLYAIFSPAPRHLLRFHALLNAVILIDEVQAIPATLWGAANRFLTAMTEIGQTRILALSATQPGVFPAAGECVPAPARFFARLNRVRLTIRHTPETVSAFCDRIGPALMARPEPTLIVLNTVAACTAVYDTLADRLDSRPVFILSARLTPAERTALLARVREEKDAGTNPVLVSTQCIEAGVDLDMARVYRDFAPLDAIIQVCGRCNRHGERAGGEVEVVRLVTDAGYLYAAQIYDAVRLESTARALAGVQTVAEPAFPPLVARYFAEIGDLAFASDQVCHAFADGAESPEIRTLLRGEDDGEAFLVASGDPTLVPALRAVAGIADWRVRRHALQRLLPRIARCSVSLRVSSPAAAEQMTAETVFGFRVVREEYYDAGGVGLTETPRGALIV